MTKLTENSLRRHQAHLQDSSNIEVDGDESQNFDPDSMLGISRDSTEELAPLTHGVVTLKFESYSEVFTLPVYRFSYGNLPHDTRKRTGNLFFQSLETDVLPFDSIMKLVGIANNSKPLVSAVWQDKPILNAKYITVGGFSTTQDGNRLVLKFIDTY